MPGLLASRYQVSVKMKEAPVVAPEPIPAYPTMSVLWNPEMPSCR